MKHIHRSLALLLICFVGLTTGCQSGSGEPNASFMRIGPNHAPTSDVQVYFTQAPSRAYAEIGLFSMTVWHTMEVNNEYSWLREYCRRVGADGMIVMPSDSTGYGKYHGRVLRVMAIKYR